MNRGARAAEYYKDLHSLPREVEYLVRKERDHMSLSELHRLSVEEQVSMAPGIRCYCRHGVMASSGMC